MKRVFICLGLLTVGIIGFGCSHEDGDSPVSLDGEFVATEGDADKTRPQPLRPGRYYSFFYNEEVGSYSDLNWINTRSGVGTYVWQVQVQPGGNGETSFGWIPFGLAFDVDGTMYTTENIIAFDSALVESRFVRVDSGTGEVTPISDITVPFNTSGPDIDACGNFYVCGFQVEALGYIWGNDSLWRVDKETGEFTEVGPTGHTNWMDLAFDSEGTLWGTFDNELYIIDTETGASTLISEIQDVPDAEDPRFMEIMSIAFDKHDVLYGTGLTVHWLHPEGSPVMKIDPWTGETELLGYSQTPDYNHGGDILPTRVKIVHYEDDGSFECKWISMSALPAHLAHGDYVPGSVGHDCDCPEEETIAIH